MDDGLDVNDLTTAACLMAKRGGITGAEEDR